MGKVTYNQSGYCGSSMSERAREAYEDGEAPKSKWTKTAMLAALDGWAGENDRVLDEDVEKMRKDEIWSRFFKWKSWHHTGKFANETDFYGLDEDAVEEASRPMTETEREAAEAARRARIAEREAREAEREARELQRLAEKEREIAEFERANGCVYDSIEGYVIRLTAFADKMDRERPRFWLSAKGSLMLETDMETFNLTSSQSLTHFIECEFHAYVGTARFREIHGRIAVEAEEMRAQLAGRATA